MPAPAASSAARAAKRIAGDECRSSRSLTNQWSYRVASRVRMDPALAVDPELARDGVRAEDQRRRLVGLDVRVQELRVRQRHEAVVRGRRGDLRGAALLRRPGVRVGGGDAREPGPELAETRAVLVEGRALECPQRVLEERIHDDRGDQVRLGLLGGRRRPVAADDLGPARRRRRPAPMAARARRAARDRRSRAPRRRRRSRRRARPARSASRAGSPAPAGCRRRGSTGS